MDANLGYCEENPQILLVIREQSLYDDRKVSRLAIHYPLRLSKGRGSSQPIFS